MLDTARRQKQKADILAACQALIAEGLYPSARLIRERIGGRGSMAIISKYRNQLTRERKIDWRGTRSASTGQRTETEARP